MPLAERTLEIMLEFVISTPEELAQARGQNASEFLARHPHLRSKIETIMFGVSNNTGISREQAEIVLNLVLPELLVKFARPAAELQIRR